MLKNNYALRIKRANGEELDDFDFRTTKGLKDALQEVGYIGINDEMIILVEKIEKFEGELVTSYGYFIAKEKKTNRIVIAVRNLRNVVYRDLILDEAHLLQDVLLDWDGMSEKSFYIY